MATPTPWDELQRLVPPPATLRGSDGDADALLPARFGAAVARRHHAHVAARSAARDAQRAPSLDPVSQRLDTLLAHFRRLMASPSALRDALEGPARGSAVIVSDPEARDALAKLLPRLADFASLKAEERAAWLAETRVGKEVTDAGIDGAEKMLSTLETVFAKVKTSAEDVDAEVQAATEPQRV